MQSVDFVTAEATHDVAHEGRVGRAARANFKSPRLSRYGAAVMVAGAAAFGRFATGVG